MGSNNGQRIQTTKTQRVFKVTYFGASDLKLKGFRSLIEVKLIVCRHVGSDTFQLDSLFYLELLVLNVVSSKQLLVIVMNNKRRVCSTL